MRTAKILIVAIKEAVKMPVDLQIVARMPSVIVTGMKDIANVSMALLVMPYVHAGSVSILTTFLQYFSCNYVLNNSGHNY